MRSMLMTLGRDGLGLDGRPWGLRKKGAYFVIRSPQFVILVS
jgi:hypothetical protein